MRKVLLFSSQFPWLVLITLLIISLLAASQLDKVRVEISADDLLVQDDPAREYYQQIANRFGDEKIILLYLSDPALLEPQRLAPLRQLIDDIEQLPFVARTESLFSVPHLKTVDGYLNKDPYLATLPTDAAATEQLFATAFLNPFVRQTLLASDLQTMAVAVVLQAQLDDYTDADIIDALDQLTNPMADQYQVMFNIGYQHVRQEVAGAIQAEQTRLLPMAVVALLLALFLLLRQLVDILVPVMTAGMSILWTLGLMGFFNIPLNIVTSMVPILLIIVGSTEDIHLLAEFRRAQREGLDKLQAINKMALKMGGIITLTFVTTYLGFLSVSFSRIEVLWQFGALSATGLLINFAITVALIPAVLRLVGHWRLDGKASFLQPSGEEPARARRYYLKLYKHRLGIVIILSGLMVLSFAGMMQIRINHSPIDSLSQQSNVRTQFEQVSEKLSGLESLSIILEAGIQDTFLKVRYLEEVLEIQQYLLEQPGVRSSSSFLDYLSLLNAAFEEVPEPVMPDADEIVNELMIFLKFEHVQAYVSEDYSTVRILVRHNITDTQRLQAMVDGLQGFLDANLDPGLTATLTGDTVLTLSATQAMINGQLQSIAVLLLIIVIIIAMLFFDWKVGLLAVIPNIFPVAVLFGFMGFFAIPLNIGTTMAAAIAIGIAVDDTLHFMLRYNKELKISRSKYSAMYETLRSEALPVFATSLALICGFLVFTLSDFQPIVQFGMLSALVMLAALIADFVITPLLISALRLVTLWDLISLDLRRDVIEKSILFQGMKTWQIRRLILTSRVHHYRKGQKIFHQEEDSQNMYMVMRGQVTVTHEPGRLDGHLRENFLPGEVFGDVSMFAGTDRSSDATAIENTSLLVISMDGIRSTTSYHPRTRSQLFFNIARHVSNRFSALVHKSD